MMKSIHYFSLLFALLQAVISQKHQVNSPTVENLSQDIGSDVEIYCPNNNLRGLRWEKLDEEYQPIIITQGCSIFDSRYDLKCKLTSYTLQINNIAMSDEGLYQCVSTPSLNERLLLARVKVFARQKPHIIAITPPAWVQLGETIKLHCNSTGHPKPEISWTREGGIAFTNGAKIRRGNEMKISNIIQLDEGTYFCHADNGYGFSSIRNVTISLRLLPTITTPFSQLAVPLNFMVNLKCQLKNSPSSTIVWEKNNKELVFDGHPYLLSSYFDNKQNLVVSEVQFRIDRKDQFGIYSCITKSKLGETGREIHVYDAEKPVLS